jgi:hypothetical protein
MRTLAVAFAAILMTAGLAHAQRAFAPPSGDLPNAYRTAAEAKAHCPQGNIVWMNTYNRIYHFAGSHNYAKTIKGGYMCETEASRIGRAAMNEKR